MRSYPDTDIDPIFVAINMKSSVDLLLEVYIWIRQNKLRETIETK